jgi:hypothetical protein
MRADSLALHGDIVACGGKAGAEVTNAKLAAPRKQVLTAIGASATLILLSPASDRSNSRRQRSNLSAASFKLLFQTGSASAAALAYPSPAIVLWNHDVAQNSALKYRAAITYRIILSAKELTYRILTFLPFMTPTPSPLCHDSF